MKWTIEKINWTDHEINWTDWKINWTLTILNILNILNRLNELYLRKFCDMSKIALNKCFGLFGLSYKGIKRYYELKYPNTPLYFYKQNLDTLEYTKTDENDSSPWCRILNRDFGDTFKITDDNLEAVHSSIVNTYNISRTDPCLIQTIEELGDAVNTIHSKIEIEELTSNKYRIIEYDGFERIETPETIEWNTV